MNLRLAINIERIDASNDIKEVARYTLEVL